MQKNESIEHVLDNMEPKIVYKKKNTPTKPIKSTKIKNSKPTLILKNLINNP